MKMVLAALCLGALGMWPARAVAVEFLTVQVAGKSVTVCRVDLRKEHLRLFHRDDKGMLFNRLDRLAGWLDARGQKLLFAMNAGLYHADYSPVGLLVAAGRPLFPLNTASGEGNFFLKPNGVFVVTAGGARVVETSEYPALAGEATLATQSGPLLVRGGRIHPAFRPESASRLFRNGVGVPEPGVAVFAITDAPVNFYEFATLFRDVLHCPDALFFNGTISSLYAPSLKRNDFHMDLGPMIGVTD